MNDKQIYNNIYIGLKKLDFIKKRDINLNQLRNLNMLM